MNNDSSSSYLPSSEPAASAQDHQDQAADANAAATSAGEAALAESAPVSARRDVVQSPAQKRAQAQTKKKFEFVNHLTLNLDILIYAELSILYYMDCSLFRLLLRALSQMMFLTPKPAFIPPAPIHRPYIGAILLPNLICLLLHLFTARPEGGEAMRGYLHGGIIIDLIGQKGPSTKIRLVGLDLLVLGLQCFMLAVHVEKERLSVVLKALTDPAPTAASAVLEEGVGRTRDPDVEERGEGVAMRNGDVEMQDMIPQHDGATSSRHNEADDERSEERERLLAEPPPTQEDEDDGTLDILWSGGAIVADFHIIHNMRRQWDDYGTATESAIQTVGFSAEFAAVTASRRMNAASARFQRDVESLGAP